MLELEIAIVGEHELTLPPASFPWDQFDRQDQLWERTQDLKRVRAERERALLRRWLRRGSYLRTVAELMWGLSCCMGDGHRTSRWY